MSSGALIAEGLEKERRPASATRLRRAFPAAFDPAGLAGLAIAVAAWYAASAAIGKTLPPPHAVVGNALANLVSSDRLPGIGLPRGGYLPHLLYTAYDVLLG